MKHQCEYDSIRLLIAINSHGDYRQYLLQSKQTITLQRSKSNTKSSIQSKNSDKRWSLPDEIILRVLKTCHRRVANLNPTFSSEWLKPFRIPYSSEYHRLKSYPLTNSARFSRSTRNFLYPPLNMCNFLSRRREIRTPLAAGSGNNTHTHTYSKEHKCTNEKSRAFMM